VATTLSSNAIWLTIRRAFPPKEAMTHSICLNESLGVCYATIRLGLVWPLKPDLLSETGKQGQAGQEPDTRKQESETRPVTLLSCLLLALLIK